MVIIISSSIFLIKIILYIIQTIEKQADRETRAQTGAVKGFRIAPQQKERNRSLQLGPTWNERIDLTMIYAVDHFPA